MRPSSAIEPREVDEEDMDGDPQPPSRKARKYIDRKAPKVNFLRKIFWSKRRRALFYILTLVVFLVNTAVLLNLSLHFKTFTLPAVVRHMFLGYNFLYNTQTPGPLTNTGWLMQMIWRTFWFYTQWLYSIRILYLRAYNIKHHENDIGTWLPKDWKMLKHKLARIAFLFPVAIIILVDILPMTNPRIVNASFKQECQLSPTYEIGLESIFSLDGNIACGTPSVLDTLPLPESRYKAYVPDSVVGSMAGQVMVSMVPVGICSGCSKVPDEPEVIPFFTTFTRPNRSCPLATYNFSNWVTTSTTCDALVYNDFYSSTFVPDSNFVEQWFCNLNSTKNSTHMTVLYDTAFGRAATATCSTLLDADFIRGPPGLLNHTAVSHVVSNLTRAELNILTGRYYEEFRECAEVQVSCTKDSVGAQYYRSVSLFGCSRVFAGSLTADLDQPRWDKWLADWVYAYKLAGAGMAVETIWDYVEYLAYVFI